MFDARKKATARSSAWRSTSTITAFSGFSLPSCKKTGELAGAIGLAIPGFEEFFTPCVEVGWRLSAPNWNQGLATEGARAVVAFASETLGLAELVSFTTRGNLRSRHVMEKLGMHYAGDFEHPRIAEGHALRPHVLYRLANRRKS